MKAEEAKRLADAEAARSSEDAERAKAEAEAAENDGWVRYGRYVVDTDTLRRRAELADSVALEERKAKMAERRRGDALEGEKAALKVQVGSSWR